MNLVTGGCGFIGSHLTSELLRQGQRVRVFDLPTASARHLPLDRVEIVRGDIRDRAVVESAMKGISRVYHLAGIPHLWCVDKREMFSVNHMGSKNVLEVAVEQGVERILHCSTESILVGCRPGEPLETASIHAEVMPGPYCVSKMLAEQEAFKLVEGGAPIIVVNPTLPIGPGDRGLTPPTQLTLACCKGELPGFLECDLNVIDARDVAQAMIAAMQVGKTGRRYILAGRDMKLSQWLTFVSKMAFRPPPRRRFSFLTALLYAYAAEFFASHFTGQRPLASVTGVRLTRFPMSFGESASLKELGINPRTIEESLRDAIAWYRVMKWI